MQLMKKNLNVRLPAFIMSFLITDIIDGGKLADDKPCVFS